MERNAQAMIAGTSIVRAGMIAVLLAGMLSGCGWAEWPPKSGWFAKSNPPPRPPEQRQQAVLRPAPRPPGIIVKKGDTVYMLARRHGVSVRRLIESNNLRPPYQLHAGRRLILPRGRTHVIKRGDTLYGISRRYGVDAYALARANSLKPPYAIRAGQTLRIPGGGALSPSVGPSVASSPRPASGPARAIAAKPLAPPPSRTAVAAAVPKPPPPSGQGFIWPVRGEVVSQFGTKTKGLHNDGINIAAPRGAPVRTVENGVVVYAGNELRGFGNLLLIKHADGWVTAYAHNRDLLVKRGARVTKGQIIARVGSSGNVSQPQLHFELRRGKRAVDPRKHLKS